MHCCRVRRTVARNLKLGTLLDYDRAKVKVKTCMTKALRCDTRCQRISPFYLHTHAFIHEEMNRICLCLPSRSCFLFADPGEMAGWVGLGVDRHQILWESGAREWDAQQWLAVATLLRTLVLQALLVLVQGDPVENDASDKADGSGPTLRSDARNYGRHLDTEHGKSIHQMQLRFESGFRRRPMSKEINFTWLAHHQILTNKACWIRRLW